MKKIILTIGSLVLTMGLMVPASAQDGKKPKPEDGKRPSEIVRQPKGSDPGKGGSGTRPDKPPNNDRGNGRGDKPKKPNS